MTMGLSRSEEWRPVPGYEGIYDASSLGRIRSTPGKITSNARYSKRVWKERILKPKYPLSSKRRDARVTLWKDGASKDFLVSRLVASAWLGVPDQEMTVNHINGDYTDNRPANLEWVTLRDNIKMGYATGLYKSIQKSVILTPDDGPPIVFSSMCEASSFLGRNHGYISNLLVNGKCVAVAKNGASFEIG